MTSTCSLSGVQQIAGGDPVGGLVYAFGAPVAADTALFTLFGGLEVRIFQNAASTIIGDFTGITYAPSQTQTVTL